MLIQNLWAENMIKGSLNTKVKITQESDKFNEYIESLIRFYQSRADYYLYRLVASLKSAPK